MCTCSPFEEGSLHTWIGGAGCPPPPLGWGRFKKAVRGGQPAGLPPNSGRKLIALRGSGTLVGGGGGDLSTGSAQTARFISAAANNRSLHWPCCCTGNWGGRWLPFLLLAWEQAIPGSPTMAEAPTGPKPQKIFLCGKMKAKHWRPILGIQTFFCPENHPLTHPRTPGVGVYGALSKG